MYDDLKLVFADESVIPLGHAGVEGHYVTNCADVSEYVSVLNKLTPENLAELTIKNGADVLRRVYDSTLSGVQFAVNPDTSLAVHLYTIPGSPGADEATEADYIEALNDLGVDLNEEE